MSTDEPETGAEPAEIRKKIPFSPTAACLGFGVSYIRLYQLWTAGYIDSLFTVEAILTATSVALIAGIGIGFALRK